MPTILLLEGTGGRHALRRYQSLLSAGAWAAAALLSAQTVPACRLDTQGAALLPKGKADAEAAAVKQPTAAGVLPTAQNADPDSILARGGKAAGAVPLCGESNAENRAAKPAEHRRAMALPALLPGYGAAGQPTGKAEVLPLSGTAAENAAGGVFARTVGVVPPIAEKAVQTPCGSCEAAFIGGAGGITDKAAAESKEAAEAAAHQTVEGSAALPLRKTAAAEIMAAEGITVLALARLSLVPEWEYPVQQGDTLTVTQVYSAAQLGDTLEVT